MHLVNFRNPSCSWVLLIFGYITSSGSKIEIQSRIYSILHGEIIRICFFLKKAFRMIMIKINCYPTFRLSISNLNKLT